MTKTRGSPSRAIFLLAEQHNSSFCSGTSDQSKNPTTIPGQDAIIGAISGFFSFSPIFWSRYSVLFLEPLFSWHR
ncbi:hypothetical protein BJX62DRAFT_206628 [Aspergillus germanicus]